MGFERLDGVIPQLAADSDGCEVVHNALDVAKSREDKEMIVRSLWWDVRILIASPYGCEILQSCAEILSPNLVGFIAMELVGSASAMACMEEKHRIICTLLECLPSSVITPIVAELSRDVVRLSCNAWANSVVEQLLEYEETSLQHCVCKQLAAHAAGLANDRRARCVLKKAMEIVSAAGISVRTSIE